MIPGVPDVWIYIAGGVVLLGLVLTLAIAQPGIPATTPTATAPATSVAPTNAANAPTAVPPATRAPVPTTADQAQRPLANVAPAQRANYYKAAPALSIDPKKKYTATIVTDKGNIVVELNAAQALQSVNNFMHLARQGFYDGLTFHRVEPGFVIQGGDPQGTGSGGPGYVIPAEIGLKHTDGAIAMARTSDAVNPKRDSSGSQFYITLGPQPGLDNQYTVFGQVITGLDVTRKITKGDVIRRIDIVEQ
jgi:cyclophilin family peptidyl-prolyl cis-trans isomerase